MLGALFEMRFSVTQFRRKNQRNDIDDRVAKKGCCADRQHEHRKTDEHLVCRIGLMDFKGLMEFPAKIAIFWGHVRLSRAFFFAHLGTSWAYYKRKF